MDKIQIKYNHLKLDQCEISEYAKYLRKIMDQLSNLKKISKVQNKNKVKE